MPATQHTDRDLDRWLRALGDRSWMVYTLGDRAEPNAVVSVIRAPLWADVIILRGPGQAAAYRTLVRPEDDPLTADWVVWHYLGAATWTIPAALHIPDHAVAEHPYPIPAACRLPETARRPMTMRPGRRRVPPPIPKR